MTHVLHLDFETRSPVDIGRCGAYKYIEHEEFAPLLLAYALDDDDVQVHDFLHDGPMPSELEWMICNSDIKKSAHNAAFERTVLQRMTRCYQPPEEWIDTMMLSAYCGLPLGLDAVCKAMHFSEDKQKMSEGKKLIRWFCNPTPAGKFRKPEDAPEKWKTFIEYCRQDVVTEREIYNQLQKWLPGESEFELWSLDQRMNDKGIRIDRQLATNAMAFDERYKAELTEKAIALTGIKNPSSVTQIKQYLKEKEGLEVETLNKTALPDVIASLKTDEAKEFMDIRIDLAKSSTKKYESMVRCACADDHVRGTLQFYGGHTGRWAGRLLQVQNFSKNKMPDIDNARYFVREGDYDTTEMLYGSVSSTLSELTRTGIIPEEGCHFIVADFSAIEARVTAALAKEEWRLKSFREGKDIYCESASAMFHVPVVKHGINGELRQKGKIAELACGFGGSVGALKAFGADKMGLTDEEMVQIVDNWRASSPNIVNLWKALESAAIRAVTRRGTFTSSIGNIIFQYEPDVLWMVLPSGRRMAYWEPRYEEAKDPKRYGKTLSYMYLNQTTKKWERIETFAGRICENLVQAVARDCLKEALLNLTYEGYDIRMHVHDEVIINEPDGSGRTVEDVIRVMTKPVEWLPNLPLDADGYECPYYIKD